MNMKQSLFNNQEQQVITELLLNNTDNALMSLTNRIGFLADDEKVKDIFLLKEVLSDLLKLRTSLIEELKNN